MKKINNKGVTLIELIVSFALVGVAIIYFFQTLYTVKKVYATARTETNEFIDRDYAYRVFDAYFDTNSLLDTDNLCGDGNKYGLKCNKITFDNYNNRMSTYTIKWKNGDKTKYYKYKGLIVESNGNIEKNNCVYACDSNNVLADFHVSNNAQTVFTNSIEFTLKKGKTINELKLEYNQNCGDTSYCKLNIGGNEITDFSTAHKETRTYNNINKISLTHRENVQYCTCYATVTHFKLN